MSSLGKDMQRYLHGDLCKMVHAAPMSTEFFRQEYWNRLLFPPLGDLPNPGTESMFPALVGEFFITKPPEKLTYLHRRNKNIHPYKTCAWELYS